MLTANSLHARYAAKKNQIERRLAQFRRMAKRGERALISELAYCIAAANSSAQAASKAQKKLESMGLIYSNNALQISSVFLSSHVRFHKKKAKYFIKAREKLFKQGFLKKIIRQISESQSSQIMARNAIAKEVLGLGMKEASHFLRNAGLAFEIAILDRHILKNLANLGVIESCNQKLTPKKYLEIERKMSEFASIQKIPISHLDLLFWSEETGRVFK
jgi:N-glycosylase/DNA lyase